MLAVVAAVAAATLLLILLKIAPGRDGERATTTEPEASEATTAAALLDDARSAAKKARRALAQAIEAKAARHTKEKVQEGNALLDRGNELLDASQGHDVATLERAILAFEAAAEVFADAQLTAWRLEQGGPEPDSRQGPSRPGL